MKQPKYCIIACHVLWRELSYYASLANPCFQFHFLKQGLHNTPDLLRQEVQAAIDNAGDEFDAILLGYGLCSNGLVGIETRKTRLAVMRAHDCITFLLGSKERYRTYFDDHPGTYWYSPGWIDTSLQPGPDRYEAVLRQYTETYGEENAAYLMDATENWMQTYSNAAYVDLGFGDSSQYKDYTRACADWLKWHCDFLQGNPGLIQRFLNGVWNPEEVLVVEPGYRIIASHDELILGVEPIEG